MENDRRRQAFANRFNAALRQSGKAEMSDGMLVVLLGRKGVTVTTQSVSNWRNGKYLPRLDQFEGIAEMLGADAGYLAFGSPGVAENKGACRTGDAEERVLMESLALLGQEERAVVSELIRVLIAKAVRQDKRPGPRKRR